MKLVVVAVALFALACGAEPRRDQPVAVLDGGSAAVAATVIVDPWDPLIERSTDLPPAVPGGLPGVAPPVFPILSLPAPGPLVTGGHAMSLRALAVIDDGSLAVSVDLDGGVRLWPTLDGKHEPVVVVMNRPTTLAVTRDGSDVAIVGLDGAGSLEVVRTRPSGEALLRSQLVIERPVVGMLATTAGLVALLDDQTLALFDLRGVRTGTLVPAPGHRIAGLVTRRNRVLAFDATSDAMRGRWLEQGEAPHWGEETPPLKLDPTTAALSPDLTRIAARSPDRRAIVVVSLRTGKVIERPPIEEGSQLSDEAVVGYVDAKTLAVRTFDNQLEWWRGAGELEVSETSPFGMIAVADRRVVVGNASVLELCEYDREPRFLGYTATAASHVRTLGSSFLVASGANLIAVDGQMRAKRAIAIPAIESLSGGVEEVIAVDWRHAFVMGRNRSGWELHLVDLEAKLEVKHALVLHTEWAQVQYEPATRMYAAGNSSSVYFGYYDPKTGTASDPARYDLPYSMAAVRLLDPATSNGVVAIVVQSSDGSGPDEKVDIVEIKSVKLDRDDPVEVGRRRTVTLEIDDFNMGGVDLQAVLMRVVAGNDAFKRRRTSPDGKLVAIVDRARITLVERTGNVERWSIVNPGLDDVAWLANGDLVATGGAIAQLDRATGALGDRQCGWGFGLWDEEPGTAFAASTCDASAE